MTIQMTSLLLLQDTLFHMMHSLIPCLSRADIHPGRSIQVTVTGRIWNTQQGTPQIVQFSTRPFSASSMVVSRAVSVSVGVAPVSTPHKKNVTFILFYGPVSLVSQCGSQANICHGHIHHQTVCYGHIYFDSPLFILRVILCLLLVLFETSLGPIHTYKGATLQH
jgi:hypothetical protein